MSKNDNQWVIKVGDLYASEQYYRNGYGRPFVKDRTKALIATWDEVTNKSTVTTMIMFDAKHKGFEPTDIDARAADHREEYVSACSWWDMFAKFNRQGC